MAHKHSKKYMPKKYCVLVLGMHRSGTSALTKQIIDIGFELLSESLPPHEIDNPDGYWESRKIVMLNQRFLRELGSDWKDVNPLPSNLNTSEVVVRYQSEISLLIEAGFARCNQIVIKDPRLCILLPFWLPILYKHCDHLAVTFIARKVGSVYRSLANRQYNEDTAGGAIIDSNHASALWLRYNLNAEVNSTALNRIIFSYEQWVEQPLNMTNKIFSFLQDAMPGALLSKAPPVVKSPRFVHETEIHEEFGPTSINEIVYQSLIENTHGECTKRIAANANIRVPAEHQQEVLQPPVEMAAKIQLKHLRGRIPLPAPVRSNEESSKLKKPIIYISDMVNNPCHIYRVSNAVDALLSAGETAYWMTSKQAARNLQQLRDATIVVIHRTVWNEAISDIYSYCNFHNITTAFDIDDLIFEPEFIEKNYIHAISALPAEEQNQWEKKIKAFRKTLMSADICITSTVAIAEHLRLVDKHAYCVPNGFSSENLLISKYWRKQFQVKSEVGRIGYASGSHTHAADFAQIAEPLAKFLSRHTNWKFTVVGQLDLSPYKKIFNASQIEVRPKVAHVNLAYEIARFDINVIPLERNPFCDAKSPLKYFEAAICGVPSIATNNPMFAELIGEKNLGLLATGPDDWYEHMAYLATDEAQRIELAERANEECRRNFSPERMAIQLKRVFERMI